MGRSAKYRVTRRASTLHRKDVALVHCATVSAGIRHLLITFSAALLTFVTGPLVVLLGFLGMSLTLRRSVLTMGLLLTLDGALRWLPLVLGWRTTLLRRRLGGGPLNVCASLLRRLSTRR
jgi:hypothetical protein